MINFILGVMEGGIKVNGYTASNTEKENFIILKQNPGKKEFGAMAEEFNGITNLLLK